MSPGLIAFFVILSVLFAFYALLAPTYSKTYSNTGDEAPAGDGLFERIVRPAVRNFLPQTPMSLTEHAKQDDNIRALLARTGNPWRVSPEEYMGVRILSVVGGIVLMLIWSMLGFLPVPIYLAMIMGAVFGYLMPKALLDMRWAKRRREIRATLPEALDLLRICLNAGFSFANALKQTTGLLPPGTTKEELSRASAEMDAGRSLNDALTTLVRRCPTDAMEAFVKSIIQANDTGADISETLAYQADETRAEYERVVETRAQKLQTTLFFPIIVFLLPSLMILLFGPSVATLGNFL